MFNNKKLPEFWYVYSVESPEGAKMAAVKVMYQT